MVNTSCNNTNLSDGDLKKDGKSSPIQLYKKHAMLSFVSKKDILFY